MHDCSRPCGPLPARCPPQELLSSTRPWGQLPSLTGLEEDLPSKFLVGFQASLSEVVGHFWGFALKVVIIGVVKMMVHSHCSGFIYSGHDTRSSTWYKVQGLKFKLGLDGWPG